MTPVIPKPAATLILIRNSPEGSLETLLIKRPNNSGWMPNVHVFPGGKLDEADRVLAKTLPDEMVQYAFDELDQTLEPTEALAYLICAIRETAEECGLQLLNGQLPDVFSLFSLSWWITPEFESHRYNTRFFAAPAPEDQAVLLSPSEATESLWIAPQKAVDLYHQGEIQLAPPTFATLEWLGREKSLEAIKAKVRHPIAAVRPVPQTGADGELVLALPNSPYPGRNQFRLTADGRFV